jgi:hypothetical protein
MEETPAIFPHIQNIYSQPAAERYRRKRKVEPPKRCLSHRTRIRKKVFFTYLCPVTSATVIRIIIF